MSIAQKTALAVVEKIENDELRDLCHESLIGTDRTIQVEAFHGLYNVPVASNSNNCISHMSDERIGLRLGLIIEEVKELLEDGFGIQMQPIFKVLEDPYAYGNVTDAVKSSGYRDIVGAADALGDISYVTDGFALEIGIPLNDVIKEIHASNLTKLGEDGHPIIREDGKVLKGPHFVEPNLAAIVERNN